MKYVNKIYMIWKKIIYGYVNDDHANTIMTGRIVLLFM